MTKKENIWNDMGCNTCNIFYDIDMKLDDVYSKLQELTDGEEDKELREYNEYLLDSIQEAIQYIHRCEQKIAEQREKITDLL